MELSRQCSSVAVTLMQRCRTTLEIQTILHGNRKQIYGFKDLEYARAKQAIAFEQKEVKYNSNISVATFLYKA